MHPFPPASPRPATRSTSAAFQTVRASGHAIALDTYGDPRSAPVLLLHGIPGWRANWCAVAEELSDERRLIVPDLLGFGDSSAPDEDFHAFGQAHALLGLLDALGVARADVVGFDFGGPVAVALSTLARERVRSITVISANLFTDTPIPGPLKLARVPLVGDAFFRMAFGRAGLYAMWRSATRRRDRFPLREYRRALTHAGAVRWTRRIFFESMKDLPRWYGETERALRALNVPALVLWADRDPFFAVQEGERLARAIPRARLVVLEDTGHFVPEEQPAAVARALREHLAAVDELEHDA